MHPYKHTAHASGRHKMSKLGGHHTKTDAHERAHGGKIIVKMHHRAKHHDTKVHGMKSGGRLDKPGRGAKHIHHTKVDVNLGGGPLPMGATPGMTPNAGPPPGMSAGPMPAGVPGMGGLQKRGGAIHKYAKGGRIKRADGGDVPTPYIGSGGNTSDTEKEQYDTRTGQTTENVGMKYPKSSGDESEGLAMPSSGSAPTTVSAKSKPAAPRAKAAQPKSKAAAGVSRPASSPEGPKYEPYSYNQMMAMHKRGGKAYATGGKVKPEFPKSHVKSNGQAKIATVNDGVESTLTEKEQRKFLKRADGGRIRAQFPPSPPIKFGAGSGLNRIRLAKDAKKINRPA